MTQSAATTPTSDRQMRRILFSSFMGTTIEYYDFILYATAAGLVFNHVFFAGLGPTVALLVSFGTLAVGYLARPLGGVIFGHIGDRVGRKKVLIITVLMMGISSTLIGLLPTTAMIGVAAPLLLVTLRILQGIAVGGEWGGATLLAFESAKKQSRGFAAAFAYIGAPAGTLAGTLILSWMSMMPRQDFLAWGWRVPFVFSLVLMGIGLFIRAKVSDAPVFQALLEKAEEQPRVPVAELFTRHPRALLTGIAAALSGQMTQGIMGIWALTYAIQQAAISQSGVLNAKALGTIGTLTMVLIGARLSDRFGRRRVLILGNLLAIALVVPVLLLLQAGTMLAFMAAILLGLSTIQGFVSGPYGAYASELFPTRVRYTGASISYQTASTLAGFAPLIATALVAGAGGSLWSLGVVWGGVILISLIALVLAPDRSRIELTELDARVDGTGSAAVAAADSRPDTQRA
ncbi:MFS transporter [Enemella evansiae]|uniref:MFS transporter n=1 Tax=Enemella evansiae TaxID=2016499 RepID=A0A255GEE6_9ACTN|nr:MFS transporter [Enemella evansiae]PFG68065.1 sugar phosphate permease [Propionibacteriaceae bacterium ES.041]OYN95740.1 MFS transporter [Enemella evansiae]OYO03947.1 MFS transporter [Enemella evansiae]OYO12673.1 MFS transporter [Enemella evansiae]TDO86203.1 sugar phosphate permease [Enemella evansiae]